MEALHVPPVVLGVGQLPARGLPLGKHLVPDWPGNKVCEEKSVKDIFHPLYADQGTC